MVLGTRKELQGEEHQKGEGGRRQGKKDKAGQGRTHGEAGGKEA